MVIKYFDELFSTTNPNEDDMEEAIEGLTRRVSDEMKRALNAKPIAEEVFGVLKEMHPTKAPGSDGLHAIFYKKCWEIVGNDVISFIKKAWNGEIDLHRVNETNIVLVPKVKDPKRLSHYRTISLCNVSYKILSKMIANRLKLFLPSLISQQQIAFVPRQLITDNVLVAFEIFHYTKRKTKGRKGVCAIKLDMSKAYDRVEWAFLARIMVRIGFDQ